MYMSSITLDVKVEMQDMNVSICGYTKHYLKA